MTRGKKDEFTLWCLEETKTQVRGSLHFGEPPQALFQQCPFSQGEESARPMECTNLKTITCPRAEPWHNLNKQPSKAYTVLCQNLEGGLHQQGVHTQASGVAGGQLLTAVLCLDMQVGVTSHLCTRPFIIFQHQKKSGKLGPVTVSSYAPTFQHRNLRSRRISGCNEDIFFTVRE